MSFITEYIKTLHVTDEHRYDCTIMKQVARHCVVGTVVDCCGTPLKGVCIKVITTKYEPVNHTLTDDCGAFTLIWDAVNEMQLVFAKEGYATLQLKDFEHTLTVCLKKEIITCVVSGNLLYKNYTPASPAKIQLVNSKVNLCVFSKADGSFIFTRVPSGKYTLTVSGNDCKQQSIYVTIPAHSPSHLIGTIWVEQVDILCTVHGIITDSKGEPIKNAVVILMNCATKEPMAHTVSNEHGLYFFGNIRNGCYYVEAFD